MGLIHTPEPVLPITAVFTHYPDAIDWAREKIRANWGKIVLESEAFPFEQTHYYDASMGPRLKKIFFAMEPLIDPSQLAEMKNQSNLWEEEYEVILPLGRAVGVVVVADVIDLNLAVRQEDMTLREGVPNDLLVIAILLDEYLHCGWAGAGT